MAPIMLVGRNGLIGRNHHKIFNPCRIAARAVCQVPKNIVLNGGEDVPLHEWNMLVGGRVVENRGRVVLHHAVQVFRFGNISDFGVKCQRRKGSFAVL